ncbi:type III secretion system chaperone [Noviherbaspirillum cavernae]|uniref:type III secretion system chaperone n=1 Tax=Noviherbaspirillum cavernae TaxID=2320862 RepID=UPI00131401B0|nr:type III secretion system chaperone [Noviherbaspirillum cavernae]
MSSIVNEVGRRDGVDGLRLSPEGTAAMTFRSGKKINFEYVAQSARLFVYTSLMPLGSDETRLFPLFESMLRCNFLKLGTGKGELSISLDTQQAIYQIGLDIDGLDADALDDAIDEVLKQHDECLCQLRQGVPVAPGLPLPAAAAGAGHRIVRYSPN